MAFSDNDMVSNFFAFLEIGADLSNVRFVVSGIEYGKAKFIMLS